MSLIRRIKYGTRRKGRDKAYSRVRGKTVSAGGNSGLMVALVVLTIATIVNVVVGVRMGAKITGMKDGITAKYPVGFGYNTVYVTVDVKTAKVYGYEDGFIVTNLGDIEARTKPSEEIIAVYTDINGEIKRIEDINKDNSLPGVVKYVTDDYNDYSEDVEIIREEKDKALYKNYLEDIEILKGEEAKYRKVKALAVVLTLATMVVAAAYFGGKIR